MLLVFFKFYVQITLFSKIKIFYLYDNGKPSLPLNLFVQLFVIEVQVSVVSKYLSVSIFLLVI